MAAAGEVIVVFACPVQAFGCHNRPVSFIGLMLHKATKPVLVFLCLLCVILIVFAGFLMHIWFCCVGFSFFCTDLNKWLGRPSTKQPVVYFECDMKP